MTMNDALKTIQKETGIKQGDFANEKNRLFHQGRTLLKMIEIYIEQVKAAQMTDEQFFIEFEDDLNELSVLDHNKEADL